ncbi:MAG: DEAD/DEAH box helicase family protein [Deltaproteobacteria bacterium]|nr:DEAD/DEAH box helicase family protein [Deltaproteobacteria bacterium]
MDASLPAHGVGTLSAGQSVVSRNPLYREYGVAKVLKVKNDQAKIEFAPGLFSAPPLFAHTKILRLREIERVPDPIERAETGQWDEPWRFDFRQMAACFLTANKGGQLSNARTELLPHQIFTAHQVVASARRRFLLADEVGLGKTIEAAMIWQALLQRGQARRTLVICPAGLTVQWQEEMLDKFGEFFEIFGRDFHTINPRIWDLKTCAIASLDALKREDHKKKLLENRRWDLIVFDEAHRLSAREYGNKTEKTLNFQLAEDLKEHTDALLLVTATPHQGEENHSRFINLMKLLDDEIDFSSLGVEDLPLFSSQRDGRVPYQQYILRTPKLSVTDAQGKRVFKGRNTYPLSFEMRPDERAFYEAVTAYIKSGYAIAEKLTDATQQRALGFVLTVFQKLAASSSRAIKAALTGRRMRLQDRYKKIPPPRQRELDLDERYEGEWEERNAFHTAVAGFTKNEIELLDDLMALPVERDRKLMELLKLAARIFGESDRGEREKILVFTEYRETQAMLVEALHERYGQDAVVVINGDLDIDQRRESQRAFRDDGHVRFLVSTEAGGEGINLQFCHVLINYDLPWNPMRIEQRVGRIYRYGQQKVVQIYNFRCRATVEETVYGYLEKRLERAAAALAKVTGEEPEDIIAAMLGQLEGEIDYNEIYKRTLVEGSLEQSQREIDDGIKRAQRAYEIATQSLFRNVASYSFDRYAQHLRSGVGLAELGELAERFLKAQRRVVKRADDGSLEFLTPEEIRSRAVKERYSRATFNRELAIRDPSVEFLALGHPFVDAMLRACGDVDFGGFSAQRRVKVGGVTPRNGYQFNFVIRSRVQRPEGEEYLFDLRTVFVTDAGKIDEQAAAVCASHYSEPENHLSPPRLAISEAYRLARSYLEGTAEQIWDWDEDVSVLNCARVMVS